MPAVAYTPVPKGKMNALVYALRVFCRLTDKTVEEALLLQDGSTNKVILPIPKTPELDTLAKEFPPDQRQLVKRAFAPPVDLFYQTFVFRIEGTAPWLKNSFIWINVVWSEKVSGRQIVEFMHAHMGTMADFEARIKEVNGYKKRLIGDHTSLMAFSQANIGSLSAAGKHGSLDQVKKLLGSSSAVTVSTNA